MRGVLTVNEAYLETSTRGYIMSLKSSIFQLIASNSPGFVNPVLSMGSCLSNNNGLGIHPKIIKVLMNHRHIIEAFDEQSGKLI